MNYPIPSWIQPADEVGNFSRGLSQGASIGEAQARQAQQAAEMAQQRQAQQEKLAADMLRQQAEQQTQAEYRKAQQALEGKRIKEEQDRITETGRHNLQMEGNYGSRTTSTAEAASARMANQIKFTDELKNNGGDVAKALIAVPGFLSPTTIPLLKPGRGADRIPLSLARSIDKELSAMTGRTPEQEQLLQSARKTVNDAFGVVPPPAAPAAAPPIPPSADPSRVNFGGGVSMNAPPSGMAGPMPVGPSMAPPPMAPAPAAPTAPQFSAPPPKEKRQKDQTYQTPKGPYTWTGDGWKAYEAPSHDEVPSDSAPATPADEEPTDEEQ